MIRHLKILPSPKFAVNSQLGWYARRWSIETFFKTLKRGCKIEDIRLTTANRLTNCIALCCAVAWRISWLTILARQKPTGAPAAVFTETERILPDRKMPSNRKTPTRDLAFYMTAVARLGGYLDRNSDPPPGTTVIWRGFTRLSDLDEGFRAAKQATQYLWVIERAMERLQQRYQQCHRV